MDFSHKNAFTVAEIFVAILVLGLIYSLTFPSLKRTYERNIIQANFADIMKETNKALLNYSMHMYTENADGENINNHCQGDLVCTDLFNNNGANAAENLSKEFSIGYKGTNCWRGQNIANNLDGTDRTTDLSNLSCFNSNGKFYATNIRNASCSTNWYNGNAGDRNKLQHSCGFLFVDINGIKSPNTFGRDVFIFAITNSPPSYLYPIGGQLLDPDAYTNRLGFWTGSCGNNNSQDGRTCGGSIVEQGMKVRYIK